MKTDQQKIADTAAIRAEYKREIEKLRAREKGELKELRAKFRELRSAKREQMRADINRIVNDG